MLVIGKVLKPQGIKGEIKILPLLDSAESFSKIKAIIIDETNYSVDKCRVSGNFVYLKLSNVNSMSEAEALRSKDILIDNAIAPELEEGRYYIDNLIGCNVFTEEDFVGTLSSIYQYGSADVYELTSPNGKVLFPFLKKLISKVDIENKKINLIAEEFHKVAVYED